MYKTLLFLTCISVLIFSCHTYKTYNNILSAEDSANVIYILQQSKEALRKNKTQADSLAQQAMRLCTNKKHPDLEVICYMAIASSKRYNIGMSALFDIDKKAINKAKESKNQALLFTANHQYAYDLISFNLLDEAPSLIRTADSISLAMNNDSIKSWQFYLEGLYTFKLQSNLSETEKQFQRSLTIAQRYSNEYLAAWDKIWIFQTHIFRGEANYTTQLAFEALNFFEKNHYPEEVSACETIIGDGYRVNGNITKAIEYLTKAYPTAVLFKNYITALRDQTSLHYEYVLNNDLASVASTLPLINKYADTLSSPFFTAMAKIHNARYYTYIGKYGAAANLFKEGENEAIKINSAKMLGMVYVFEAEFYGKQNKVAESDSIQAKAYVLVQKTASKELIENSYKTNKDSTGTHLTQDEKIEKRLYTDSAFAAAKGKEAIKALRHNNDTIESRPVIAVFDSSVLASYNKQLLDYETQFKTHQKDDSLRIARQETIIANNSLHTQNLMLTGASIITLLLAAGLFLQYKNRKRAEADKAKIEILQNEIHHRVKNNLSVIRRLIEVAGMTNADHISLQSLQSRVTAIELLHKRLYNDKMIGSISLQEYLNELTTAIQNMFDNEKEIHILINTPVSLSGNTAEKIGLIVNELVTNSYKYAFDNQQSGTIEIEADTNGANEYKLTVTDNGKGFTPAKSNSYGMKLIAGLSHELRGKFSFNNDKGTRFVLQFPNTI